MKSYFSPSFSLLTLVALSLFIGAGSVVQAQTPDINSLPRFTVKGVILDKEEKLPLTGVRVQVQYAFDTSFVRAVASDVDGMFEFKSIPIGRYTLSASFLGFKTEIKEFQLRRSDLTLDTLYMVLDSKQLEDVVVSRTAIRAEQKGDTTVYNAAAFKANPDATVEQLVRKMPGITIEGGEVKAQGETVRRVLIDGREFFGDDATAALRNLPAEIVDRIQVFDRMSDQAQFTGVDDGNQERTINIMTKGGLNSAQFGRVYAGYGTSDRYAGGGNISMFDGDRRISIVGLSNNTNQQNFSSQDIIGLTGNNRGGGRGGMPGGFGGAGGFFVGQQPGINSTNSIGINYTDKFMNSKLDVQTSYFFNNSGNENLSQLQRQYFLEGGNNQFYSENYVSESSNYNNRINGRITYNHDARTSVIFTPNISFQSNSNSDQQIGINSLSDTFTPQLNTGDIRNSADNSGYRVGGNILFRRRLDKPGRTVTLNVNTNINNNSRENFTFSNNVFFDPMGNIVRNQSIDQVAESSTGGYTISPNLTFTEQLNQEHSITLSYNPSFNKNNSEQFTNALDPITNSYTVTNDLLSNRFDNLVHTQRGGATYRYQKDKLSINLGANVQWLNLTSDQTYPVNLLVDKSFVNVLPNAMITYNYSRTSNLRIFYRTNTNTPSARQLQNVIDNSNPLRLSAGNPNLEQAFSNNLSFRFNRANVAEGTTFFVFGNVGYTSNYITNTTTIATDDTDLGNGITLFRGSQLSQPANLDGFWNVRTFMTYGMPSKLLKSNINVNAGMNYTRTPGLTNSVANITNNYGFNSGVVVSSNISEAIDFTTSTTANYNIVRNSFQPDLNNNFYTQASSMEVALLGWKKLVLVSELRHNWITGLGEEFNQSIWLWNVGLGYKFLKDNLGELRLTGFDLLNQNNSINRNITQTYVEDLATQVLTRYFTLTFTYNIRNIGQAPVQRGPQMPFGMPGGGMPWGGRGGN